MNDYLAKKEYLLQTHLNSVINDNLPDICREYFIAIENTTSILTRLNYAYDLHIFFDYLTKDKTIFYGISVKQIKTEALNSITTTNIELFLSYLTYYTRINAHGKEVISKNADKAKARKLSSIRALFKYLYKKNYIKQNITTIIDTPKIHDKEIIRMEPNEVSNLLDIIESGEGLTNKEKKSNIKTKNRDLAILTLFLGTGIRISECIGLNINDVNLNDNSFVITRKGGNRVILYFSDEVKSALENHINDRKYASNDTNIKDNKALFLSLQNNRISTRAVQNLVSKYCKIASPLKHLSPHKMRSTYGTQLYRETGDIYIVADVLGHKDVNTTKKHYAAISDDIRRKASTKVTLRETEILDE